LLHRETVERGTFALLEELMQIDFLGDFNLVGGTGLALLLGHRKSVDIDLFNVSEFNIPELKKKISDKLANRAEFHSSEKNKMGVFGYFEGVKLDLCRHPYPLLNPIQKIDGIRIWSMEDIAASKVFAIASRATKKDFWDIDILFELYSPVQIAEFYHKRYQQGLAISVAKMLTYFDEAEDTAPPVCLRGKTWNQVKKSISKKINQQMK
jgi:predicted nucleotidyltransferase component of viral defense system